MNLDSRRICSKCQLPGEFYKNRRSCKKCDQIAYRIWRAANIEHLRLYENDRQRSPKRRKEVSNNRKGRRRYNPEYREKEIASNHRQKLKRYGLTPDQYKRLFDAQKGLCAICQKAEKAKKLGRTRALNVDHDHKTGKVRGLL